MKFEEKEGYYYEFRLDAHFVPSTIIENLNRRTWVANHVNNQLGQFISENIVKDGLRFSPDRIVLISAREEDRTIVKRFCQFMMDNENLLNIAVNNIITRFNLDDFQVDLTKVYEKYTFKENLTKELSEQPSNGAKKIKV